jgi:hypothetical protein
MPETIPMPKRVRSVQEEQAFVELVTNLNDVERWCAEEAIRKAELCGEHRNIVLQGVINRLARALKDASGLSPEAKDG